MSPHQRDGNRSARHSPLSPSADARWLHERLWQLEMWLREMVYVEARASHPEWESLIHKQVKNWPPASQTNDKRYRHMATRHQSALSYLTTGELFDVMRSPANWPLFEKYFQPKNIFEAKFEELKQIRNRIAHFRAPHEDDVERVRLFLKEIDAGVWRFCSSMSAQEFGIPPPGSAEPVSDYFMDTHDRRFVVEMHDARRGWFYARDRMRPRIGFKVGFSVRPGTMLDVSSLAGRKGILYHASFMALRASNGTSFDHEQILKDTESHHPHCVHIKLRSGDRLEVSIPSVLGEAALRETIERFLEACIQHSGNASGGEDDALRALAERWPEYVLPPDHPIGLLSSDTPCSMFELESP